MLVSIIVGQFTDYNKLNYFSETKKGLSGWRTSVCCLKREFQFYTLKTQRIAL